MKLKLNKQVLKSKLTIFYVLAGIFGLGFSSVAANAVPFESRAMAANVTAGDTRYYDSGVAAKSGDVVKIQVYYHNKAAADSGRVATNVNVKFTMPNNTLKTSNSVSTRVSGSNINTISDSTAITTSIPARLEYIPGTAYRKYNAGTNSAPNIREIKITDSVVTGTGYNISEIKPCWNFEETITIQARVLAPAVTIDKKVRVIGQNNLQTDITANPGDTLEYAFEIKNVGSMTLTDTAVKDIMPSGINYVPGSARLYNSIHPNGAVMSDNLFSNGVIIGNYTPGINAVIRFQATVPTSSSNCGTARVYTNKAYVWAKEIGQKYNNAIVRVTYPCVETYNITAIKFNDRNHNGTQDSGESRMNDWGMTLTGNGQNATIRTNSNGEARFNNLTAGTYTVTEESRTGWTNSRPTSVAVNLTNSDQTVIFGNYQNVIVLDTGSISALKYEDLNGNGTRETNEPGIANWEIRLTDSNNHVTTRRTGSDGHVDFTDLEFGTYSVAEVQQSGWRNTTPLVQSVALSSTNVGPEVRFGNQRVTTPPPVIPDGNVTPVSSTVITTGKGTLATSGPADAAAGALGTVSLGGVAFAWMKSKKALLTALKKY